MNHSKGIILDCVGVLLVPRGGNASPALVEELDYACGQTASKAMILDRFCLVHNLDYHSIDDLWARMINKYEPNHAVLGSLTRLRSEARVAMFNNGCPESFFEWVEKYSLRPFFDVVNNSYRLGLSKPNPEAFRLIAFELGCRPDHCVLVDDQIKNLRGAANAGLKTMHFVQERFPKSDDFTAEVLSRLDSLNDGQSGS